MDVGRKQLSINTLGTISFLDKITPSPSEIVVNIACYYYYYYRISQNILKYHVMTINDNIINSTRQSGKKMLMMSPAPLHSPCYIGVTVAI